MRCEGCGASVFEGDAACAECGREISEAPRAPPAPAPVERDPEPVAADPEPEPELPAEAPRCAEHPDRVSIQTCARCGRFCCSQCLPEPRREKNCPACQRRVRVELNPKELARLRKELAVSFFFAAAAIAGFGLWPLLVTNPRAVWVETGAALTLFQLVAASLFLLARRGWSAWGNVASESLAVGALFVAIGPNCITVVLSLFPLVTAVRIIKWRALEREAVALAAPPAATA